MSVFWKPDTSQMGPPGTGKTLTGKALGKLLNRNVVDIDDDFLEPLWGVSVGSKLKELGEFMSSQALTCQVTKDF